MRFREVLLHGHPAGQVDELGPLDARFLISASDGPFPPTSGSRSLLAIGNQSPRLSEETKGSGKRTELPSLLTVSCLKRIRSAESEGYLGPPNDLRSHRARVGRPTFTLCFADFSFHGSSSFFFCFPPPRQSLDELEDDDGAEKDEREEQLVLANTFQNETMTADPATGLVAVRKDTSFVENGISVFK